MTPRGLHRVSSPVSPTPKRHPSPPPLHSSKNSSPISSPHHLLGSPSPPLLSPPVSSHPTDIARQIAAVTQDLAGLHAEEQRIQARAQSCTVPSQQGVRRSHNCVSILRVSSVSLTLCCRVLRQPVLPQPFPDIRFGTFYSSRMNASGAAVISIPGFL